MLPMTTNNPSELQTQVTKTVSSTTTNQLVLNSTSSITTNQTKNDITVQTIPEKDLPLSNIYTNQQNNNTQQHQPYNNIQQSSLTINPIDRQQQLKQQQQPFNPYNYHTSLNRFESSATSTTSTIPQPTQRTFNNDYYYPSLTAQHNEFNYQNSYSYQRQMSNSQQNQQQQQQPNRYLQDLNDPYRYSTNRTLSTTTSSSNSNDLVQDSIELSRLERMRLKAYMENQMPQFEYTRATNDVEAKILELESSAAALRATFDRNNSKDAKISQLEKLICQKDYEMESLLQNLQNINKEHDNEINIHKTKIQNLSDELTEVRLNYANLQKEYEAVKSKNREYDSYISTLPTTDEINETKKLINELKNEKENLLNELDLQQRKLIKAKHYIKEKQNEAKEYEEKLEKANLARHKVELEYKEFKEASKDIVDCMRDRELVAQYKVDVECAKNVVNGLNEKLTMMKQTHSQEVAELKEQLRLEYEVSIALRQEVENKEQMITTLKSSARELSQNNQNLLNQNLDMASKLSSFDTIMSNDYQKLLKVYFKELEICKNKLSTLIRNCIDIYNKQEVTNLESLITDMGSNVYNFDDNNTLMDGILNPNYLKSRIDEIKQLKSKIDELRHSVSSQFAVYIGSKPDSCMIM